MLPNRTFVWKFMTIWISRELLLFKFRRLDTYAPESDNRVKRYDHWKFSSVSIVQFQATRYIMRLNQTSEWKVISICIARENPLFNFERLDTLCTWIGQPCEKIWTFEFLKSFHCSISSVSIYYAPESDNRVKSYCHLNFSRASIVQFRASRYIIFLNRTSKWKVMTIWTSWELPLFNFEGFRVKSYDYMNFKRASVVQFLVSRDIIRLNRISEWKVMTIWISWELSFFQFRVSQYTISPNCTYMRKLITIWISRELLLLNLKCLDTLCSRIRHLSEKLWPFGFLESFRSSISSLAIYYAPESDIRVKSHYHLHFSRAFVVQFWAPWYVMHLNRTTVWTDITIWIYRELPLFNFERLNILCAWIGHPWEMLWIFEFLESFRCSISSVIIYFLPESDIRVKSDDNLNFSIASAVQFRASRCIMRPNLTSVWKVMTIWISRELLLFNLKRLDTLRTWIGQPCE